MLSYPGITRIARRVNRGCEEWCWTKKSTWKPQRSFEGNQKCHKRCSCLSLLVGSPGCRWPFPMSSDIKPGILLSVFLCSLIALVLRIHSRRRRGGKGGRAAPPPTPSWQVVALLTLTLDSLPVPNHLAGYRRGRRAGVAGTSLLRPSTCSTTSPSTCSTSFYSASSTLPWPSCRHRTWSISTNKPPSGLPHSL